MQRGQVGALGNRALGHEHQEAEKGRPAREAERAPRDEKQVGFLEPGEETDQNQLVQVLWGGQERGGLRRYHSF